MAVSSGQGGFTSINITPMVDIILVLLVIFMVTTSAVSQVEALEVDRPDAATGRAVDQAPVTLLISCDANGSVAVDGRPMTSPEQTRSTIAARFRHAPELQAVVSCDESASVHTLVQVLDVLRATGIQNYAIATEQPEV